MSKHHLKAVYVISVAAELAGMHPQTLRIYERRGLVSPARTEGGNRRYSDDDIELLRRILEQAREIALHAIREAERVDSRTTGGDLVPLKQAVAVFGQRPSIFDRE